MSKYVKSQSSKKAQVWLQRMVKFWLASGMIVMPWMVYGSEIVRSDGAKYDTHSGNVHNIYAGKDVGNGIGASTFSKFNVTAGDVANMQFRQNADASATQFSTLLNFVDSKINIDGTVNAIRGGGIGGHLYFLSSNGMAVGAGGAINAGALTVLTPTNDWWDNIAKVGSIPSRGLNADVLSAVQNVAVPINASGTIAVRGKVSATNGIRMKAGTINIGADEMGNNVNAAEVTTGVVKFTDLVNMGDSQLEAAGVNNLVAVKNGAGDILIAAEANYNENADNITGNTVKAEVVVDGGSKITASTGNVSVSATAYNNIKIVPYYNNKKELRYMVGEQDMSENEYDTNFRDKGTGGYLFGSNITTKAITTIKGNGTSISGKNVDVKAVAQNIYSSGDEGILGEFAEILFSVFLNGLSASYGLIDNYAEVKIDEGTVLTANGTGKGEGGVDVLAKADLGISLGTDIFSLNLVGGMYPNANWFPAAAFGMARGRNEAKVIVDGQLNAKKDNGTINVQALAGSSINSTLTTDIKGLGLSDAVFNFGVSVVSGYNKSNVTIGEKAELAANKDVKVISLASTSMAVTDSVNTSDDSSMAFVISTVDFDQVADLTIKGKINSEAGNITLSSNANFTGNTMNATVGVGRGLLDSFIYKHTISKIDKTIIDKYKKLFDGSDSGNVVGGVADELQQELKDDELVDAAEDSKTYSQQLSDTLKLGISFGYMNELNDSNLTIAKTAKVEAKSGDLILQANSGYDDLQTIVTGRSSNNKEIILEQESLSYGLANGAVLIRKIDNQADVVLETGDDAQKTVLSGGTLSISSNAYIPQNRLQRLKDDLELAVRKQDVQLKRWAEEDPTSYNIYRGAYDALTVEVNKFNAEVYDDKGNLKSPYNDKATGTTKYNERLEQLKQTEAYKKFMEIVDQNKYVGGLKWYEYPGAFFSALKAYTSPKSYATLAVDSSTIDKGGAASGAGLGVGICFGLDRTNDDARILVGKKAEITGTKKVTLSSDTISGGIIMDGLPTSVSKGSMYGANFKTSFGTHALSDNSIISVAEGAKITSGAELDVIANADVHRVGISVLTGVSADKNISFQVIGLSTESNTLVAIDDEAKLDAKGAITLEGLNNVFAVNVTGAIATGSSVGGAVSLGMQFFKRNNIVAIADNDVVGSLTDETAKLVSEDEYKDKKQIKKRDDEKTRLQKLLYSRSGLGNKTGTFYSNRYQTTGSVKGASFTDYAVTSGGIYNFSADVAVTSFKSAEGAGAFDYAGQTIDKAKKLVYENIPILFNKITNPLLEKLGVDVSEDTSLQGWGKYTNPKAGKTAPTYDVSVMGSVAVNSVDSITSTLLDGANISFVENSVGTFQTKAEDKSALLALGGGMGFTKMSRELNEGDLTNSYGFNGAIAVNSVNSDTLATVKNSTISGVKLFTNEAKRQGALAAAATAIAVKSVEQDSKARNLAAGVSVNSGKYNTIALMEDNTITGFSSSGKNSIQSSPLVNQSTVQDTQGAGGIDFNLIAGGKSGFAAGVVLSMNFLTNNVAAIAKATDRKYKLENIGDMSNIAVTDLTQVGAALGVGVSTSDEEEEGFNIPFQGTVAVNKGSNIVTAKVEGMDIKAKTLTVQAYDAKFATSNPHALTLKTNYKLDMDGNYYLEQACKKSDTDLQKKGNAQVGVAVEVEAATGEGSNSATGVGFVYNGISNNYTSQVKDSTVNLSGIGKSTEDMSKNAARVMAESSSQMVGIAVGGNGSTNSVAGAGSLVVTFANDQIQALVQNSEFTTSGLAINALNKNQVVGVAGQIDIGASAVGLDMVYNFLGSSTDALLENTKVAYKTTEGSLVAVTAANDMNICGVAVGVVASTDGGFAGNGSVVVNRGHNNVRAQAKSIDKKKTLSLSDFVVLSSDYSKLDAGSGGLELALGKEPVAAVGGAISINDIGPGWDKDTYEKEDSKTPQVNSALVHGYEIEKLTGIMRVEATDTAKIKTVATGTGLSDDAYVAFQGADATTRLKKNTDAKVLDTNINGGTVTAARGNLQIKAFTDNSTQAVGFVVAADFEATAIGVGLSQNLYTVNTSSLVAGGTMKLANALITSSAKQAIINSTIGVDGGVWAIGGSVVVNKIAGNTATTLGYADGNNITNITTSGNLGVVSGSEENILNLAGALEFSAADAAVGGGASIAVNELSGNTTALAQNAVLKTGAATDKAITLHDSISDTDSTYTGLVVGADALHKIDNRPFSGGLSVGLVKFSFGLDATVSSDQISGTTSAKVISLDLNKAEKKDEKSGKKDDKKEEKVATNSNLTVKATDKIYSKAVLTNALAGGMWPSDEKQKTLGSLMVGYGLTWEKNSRTVEASVTGDSKRQTVNADKMAVQADSYGEIDVTSTSVSIDVSKNAVPLNVTVGVVDIDLNETTRAIVDAVTGTNNGLSITANHKDKVDMVSTAVSGVLNLNIKSFSGSVGYTPLCVYDTSTTEAKLLNSTINHYENNVAQDLIKAYGDSYIRTQATDVGVAISLFSGAVGVLIASNDLKQVVTADVDKSTLGSDDKRARDVNILAENKVETKFTNQNVKAGMMGVGVGVGLNTVDTSVSTNITRSKIYAQNDINVQALENLTLNATMVNATAAGLAVGVNVLHNYVGTAVVQEKYVNWEDKEITAQQVEDNEYSPQRIDNIVVEATQFFQDILTNNIASSRKQDGTVWKHIDMDTQVVKKPRTTMVSSTGNKVNFVDTDLQAKHDISVATRNTINADLKNIGAGIGVVAVSVLSNRAKVTYANGISITGGTWKADNDINVDSYITGNINTLTLQHGISAGQLGVSFADIRANGDNVITLDKANLTATKNVKVQARDDLKLKNDGKSVKIALAVSIPGIHIYSIDNLKNSITLQKTGNIIAADSIFIDSYAKPYVQTLFEAVDVGSLAVGGVVLRGEANNQANLTLEGTNSLLGNTVTLKSGVYEPEQGYSVYTDVTGNAGTILGIRVNKARTYTNLVANTTVGALVLKKDKKDDKDVAASDLTIKAEDTTNIYNNIKGLTIGLTVATGTNYSTSILKSTVTTSVDSGSAGIYAKNLNIGTSSRDKLKARANGDGGGAVNISPVAAEIEVTMDGNTETTLKGKYTVEGTATIDAVRTDDLDLEVNAVQAQVAGGSGTKLFIHHINETTQVNLKQATIESAGAVNLGATTTVNVNKPKVEYIEIDTTGKTEEEIQEARKKAEEAMAKANNTYALKGNGYGGGDTSVGKLSSVMKLDTKVNLENSKIIGQDIINIGANMNGYICLANSIYSLGVLYSGAHSTTESTVTLDNDVNIINSNIRSEGVGKDLTISASEYLNLYVRTYVENRAGLIGGVNPTAKSTLNRNNKIVLNNSDLFSDQDINLYSGKALDGNLGFMNTRVQAESFNASVIPINLEPKASSTITQNNQITLMSGSDVQSIRHANIYADNGQEIISKKAMSRNWAKTYDYGSSYVSTADGKVTGVVTRDNYVQVDGGASVSAGTANITEITIGSTNGELVVMEEQERQLVKTDRTVYTAAEKNKFIHYDEKVAKIIGLSLDDFEIGSQSYSEAVATRLDEVNTLLSTYSVDSDPTVYNSLKAESDRLSSILATMRGNSGSSEQATGLTPNMIYYITIPKVTASGGNVVVNTGNFRGSGKVEAKGTPSVTIKNYTNLMLVTNEINVDDPGGIIYYNNKALEPGTGTDAQKLANMQKQVRSLNVASDTSVALNLLAAAGKAGSVYIYGLYTGDEIAFDGEYTSDGVTEKIKGSFKPKADVRVAGSINSSKGLVHVESANNDITIAGKDVKDNVAILAKKVEILANNGSITQGYTSGTVSIGGDVRSQYDKYYSSWLNKTNNQIGSSTDSSTKLITTEPYDGSKASDNMPEGGYWIAGGQVSISAADININGIIQSGYDSFTATLTAAEQSKVDSIISNWNNRGKPEVTDTQVKNGGGTYKVSEGGAYWNATRKCYEYRLNVFYNPSTKQLLTENVDASGGRIYLTGRIASTGSGRIICLDGTYNVDINNALNYDLKTGTLLVNDVKGLITITDSAYNYTTTVSSSGSETINNKTKETVTGVITGSDRSYTYNPKSDLRYEWVTGYKNTKFTPYYKESMAKWWGWASYKVQDEKTLKGWITNKEAREGKPQTAQGAPRQDGAYLTTNSKLTQDVVLRHNGTTISEKVYQDGPPERWSTGYLGCHKWTKYNFIKEQGQTFQDTCSVKASNPININFIGSKAEDSHVNVTTTQNLLLTGSLGNSQLYDVKTGDKVTGHVEKGNINLTSSQGNIIQQGGNIYGAGVNLTSAKNLENIAVIAGDTLTLSGLLKGSGIGDIEVIGAYGGGLGNVLLKDLGGTAASEVTLSTSGDILQATGTNLVQAKRINLSAGGSVGGQNGSALRLQGGQNKDASSADSLQASVNIWAEKDISISQVSGDLRIGTIYSGAGNVTIDAVHGSLVDALPYVNNENKTTEEELVAEWRSLGLIVNEDGSRTEAQKAKDSSLVAGKTSGEDFVNNIRFEYAKMLELRDKEAAKRTESDKEILSAYEAKYQGYNSVDAYLQSDNVKAQIAAFAARAEILPDQYDGWSKEALLYALQDSVINKHAGVKSSDKVPNIYGKDINITVKYDVGLNSDKTTVIDLDGKFTLNDLKTLSQADPATVSWAYNEKGHKIVTVNEKLAIGLQQIDSSGTVNITNISDTAGSSNIYVEVRKSQLDGRTGEYLNLVLGNIGTGLGGDIRISSLGSILRGQGSMISGRDVVLLAGESGSIDGNIGDVTAYLNLDMTGKLTATATGNIYLHQTSLNDWYLDSMTAGVQGANKSDTSGNIYLVSEGNIYGYYNVNTMVQGYIRSDSDGAIYVKSIGGNIGSLADKKKTVRFANSSKKGSVDLRAWDEIVAEGVSTRVGLDNAPAGTFAVTLAGDNVAQKVKLVANGTLSIGSIRFTNLDSTVILEAASLGLGSDYQANTVSLKGGYYVNQMEGTVRGMDVSIVSGQELDLTCGKSNLDAEGLKNADITQTHNSNGQNSVPKIIAGTLNISSTGVVDIDSEDNQFANVHLDVNRDTTLGGGATTDELFGKIYGYEKNIQLDVTNSHGAENEAVHGNLSVLLYEQQASDATDLTVNGNVKTDGSVVLYNEIGELLLPGQENYIRAGGSVLQYGDKGVINEKTVVSGGGVALIARGDIVNVAEYTEAKTLYLRSLEGDVYDLCLGSFGSIDGDLTLIADEGAVVNSRSYLVKGDITIEARKSISNCFADEYGNGMHSTEGDITIYTTGSEDGEGYLYNSQQMLADKGSILLYANKGLANTATIDAPQGSVTILSNGMVINGDGLDADDYIYGKKGVTLVAAVELDNRAKLYADTGDIIVAGADEYSGKGAGLVVSGSGKVINSGSIYTNSGNVLLNAGNAIENTGDIYVATEGNVSVSAMLNLGNTGKVFTEKGNVAVTAFGALINENSIYTNFGNVLIQSENDSVTNLGGYIYSGSGDVTIEAKKDLSNTNSIYTTKGNVVLRAVDSAANTGSIYSGQGNVTVNADGDVTNNGSVYAIAGAATMESYAGNVSNSDDFTSGGGTLSDYIYLLAEEGSVTNSTSLRANKDITVLAKNNLLVSSGNVIESKAGDIYICSSEGNITTLADITTEDGNITLVAQNIHNGAGTKGIQAKQNTRNGFYGQVSLLAYDDLTNGVVGTANTGIIYGQNGVSMVVGHTLDNRTHIKTDTGDVLLTRPDKYVGAIIPESEQGTAVNNAGSITVTEEGNVLLYAQGHVHPDGSITGGTMSSSGAITTAKGYIYLEADGNIINDGNLQTAAAGFEGGNITVLSNSGTLSSKGNIDAQGSVILQSVGDMIFDKNVEIGNTVMAHQGYVQVDASEGSITNKLNMMAQRGIEQHAGRNIDNEGELRSVGGDVELWAAGTLTNTGDLTGVAGRVTLASGDNLLNESNLLAADSVGLISQNGAVTSTGDITAGTGLIIRGNTDVCLGVESGKTDIVTVTAGDINISSLAGQADNYANLTTQNYGNINITAGTDLDNRGMITSAKDVCLSAGGKLTNSNTVLSAGNTVMGSGDDLINIGDVTAAKGSIMMATEGDLVNNGDAVLQATENVSLSAAITLTNEKNIRASVGSLTMEAGSTLINSGNLSAVQSLVSMVSETDALTNTATVMAGSGVTLYGAETVVNGEQGVDKKVIVTTTTGNISIVSDKATVTNYVDLISSGDGNITITAEQDLTNTGVAETSGGAVTFISNIGNLSNSETLNAGLGDVILRSAMGTLTNTADLTADKNILLDANKQLTNTGVLSAVKASISMITNAALTNEGTAQAKESIIMDAADTLQNTGELTAVTGELRMEGGTSLINVGNLSAGENLLMIAVDDLTNRGVVTAGAEVALYSQKGTLENYKNITADGNVLLLSKNNMTIGSSPMELSIVSKAGDVGLVTNAGDIRNYARIIAVKDNDGQGGGLVAVLSSGEMHNYGSIAAEKNVHLYGYRGLKNYTGADIVTQNGDVAINQRTNFKYKDYIDWLEPVGNVWNVGSIKVQQKGNILISTPGIPVNSETQVTNGGFLGTVDGNVILSSKGGLINGGDIYALNGGLVELTAQDSVVNSGNILIYSEGQGLGNVMLEAYEGDVINTGSFVKLSDATVTALNLPVISLIDGDILLSAEHGSVTNEHGLAAIGDITIRAQNSLTNGHLLEWEDTDYGLYSRDGNISMISHSGDIINEVGIYAGQGFVELNAGRNLRNTSKVDAGTSITVEAADMVVNGTIMSNDVYMETAKGDITIISASGEIVNASSLITGDGDVELTAKDDVTNGGSVVAHGDKQRNTGLVSITSETGDIRHTGSFYDAGNQFTYADGSIHLLAPEGAIYTSQDLIANNDIVVMSRDAVVKQESGGTIGNLGILSREQGDIYLYAYGTDEKGVVYNNGNLRTANGSIYIQANGSVEDELEIYGVKQTTQVSVYNNAAGDIHAVGGEVHINGLNTVVNKGDILVQIKNLQGGDLSIASEKGSVLLYNDGVTPESPQGTNIFLADGNICITAPSGVLYNEKNLLAKGNVDLHYGGGGMNTSITINNVIASQYGDISITTAGDLSELILASQITALEGKVDVISKGMLTIGNCADENGYTIKANDTVILNAVNDIRVYGKVKSETGSVNIASKKIAEDSNLVKFSAGTSAKQPLSKIVTIEGDIEAIQGVAAVGSDYGSIEITGDITGNKVVLYAEDGDANITFQKGEGRVTVGEELILSGNSWNDGIIDMSKINNGDTSGYILNLFRARNSTEGSSYVLDFGSGTTPVTIANVMVDNLVIHAEAPVKIDSLNVTDRADIYAMGTKTSIYGRMHDYDADAKVIYYFRGNGDSCIDLHEMFFDGTAEQYRNYTQLLLEDSEQFIHRGGQGDYQSKGMTLDIKSPTVQYGDGLLLRNYYGQTTNHGRYSLEQWMQHLLNLKAIDSYNQYFDNGIKVFQKDNLLEIPDVTVNQSIDLKAGVFEIDGTSTDEEGRKVFKKVKYEF